MNKKLIFGVIILFLSITAHSQNWEKGFISDILSDSISINLPIIKKYETLEALIDSNKIEEWKNFTVEHNLYNKELYYFLDSSKMDVFPPDSAYIYYKKIKNHYSNYDKLLLLNQIVQRDSFKVSADFFNTYTKLLLNQNKIWFEDIYKKRVIEHYKEFVKNNSDIIEIYFKWGDFKKVISLIKIDKNISAEKKYLLGASYYETGDYDSAYKIFEKLACGSKKTADSYLYIARIYRKREAWELAAKYYEKFSDKFVAHKKAAESLWAAAWIYERHNYLTKAQKIYKKLVRKFPDYRYTDEAMWRIAFIDYRKNNHKKALKEFYECYKKYKSSPIGSQALYWIWKIDSSYLKDEITHLENSEKTFDYYMLKYNKKKEQEFIYDEKIEDFLRNRYKKLDDNNKALYKKALDLVNKDKKFCAVSLIEKHGNDRYLSAFIFKQIEQYRMIYSVLGNEIYDNKMLYFNYHKGYRDIVIKMAEKYKIEPELIWAIIKNESQFNADVVSGAGAMGLMQIMPSTAKNLAKKLKLSGSIYELGFSPEKNIEMGTYYIKYLIDLFDGNYELAIAAYNAGHKRSKLWKSSDKDSDVALENIYFDETRNYVKKVMRSYWVYKLLD